MTGNDDDDDGAPAPRPTHRLKRRTEFLRAARQGRRASTDALSVQMRRRRQGECPLDRAASDGESIGVGITVTKKVGNAVERNRIRRRLRAAAARVLPQAGEPGADYVLVARRPALTLPFPRLIEALREAGSAVLRPRDGHGRGQTRRDDRPRADAAAR